MPTYKQLSKPRADYCPEQWEERHALIAGGQAFASLIHTFLPMNPFEPFELYNERCTLAKDSYEPHLSPIVRATEGDLFSQPFAIRARGKSESQLDPYWVEFKENCDGKGLDLSNFIRARFTEALTYGSSGWLCELPSEVTSVETSGLSAAHAPELQRLTRGVLSPVSVYDLWDYGCDDSGRLSFLVTHAKQEARATYLGTAQTVETWRVYTAEDVTTYQIRYEKVPAPDAQVPSLGTAKHGFASIPYVSLMFPPSLAILDAAAPLAKKHFRLSFSLEYALSRTSYPVPIFRTKEDPEKVAAGRFGTHAIRLGIDDHFDWVTPPTEGFEIQSRLIDSTREQLYRVTGATFLADKNNSASSERRSGVSKDADHARWETQLNGFGALVRQALEDTYGLLTAARREDLVWDISGLDKYSLQLKGVSLDEALLALHENLSPTVNTELRVSVVEKVLPSIGQDLKSKIRAEIESAQGETVEPAKANPLHSGAEQAPDNERDAT